MRKFFYYSLFLICIVFINVFAINIFSLASGFGQVKNYEGYSKIKPSNIESIFCNPYYIFDGKAIVENKTAESIVVSMTDVDFQKFIFNLGAKFQGQENADKIIKNYYSPILNQYTELKIKGKLVNMQVCFTGGEIKIGIPSLCGFV